ncbi:hypothetical protein [Nicoliella lavandulae]|uniref:Uncharacterized protein n=1 Tax=Nicoliella lavandulae TaxID=3082954 RepID=A0ABU8SIH8_9LACO
MNNQEPQSRVKRYDFNKGSKQPDPNPKNFKVWPWILGLVIVIGLLVGGIKYLTSGNNNTAQPTQTSSMASSTNSSSQSTSNSHSSNSNSTSSAKQNSSKKTAASHASNRPPQNNNQSKAPANGGSFSTPRQFSTVQDATNWAKATQSSWIQAGYSNYTITSDGQGFYVLNFIK